MVDSLIRFWNCLGIEIFLKWEWEYVICKNFFIFIVMIDFDNFK